MYKIWFHSNSNLRDNYSFHVHFTNDETVLLRLNGSLIVAHSSVDLLKSAGREKGASVTTSQNRDIDMTGAGAASP